MYLSYSGDNTFRSCRRAYYHRYVAKTVVPEPENRVHMLYGDTVGKIFESFYTDKLWQSDTTNRMMSLAEPTLQRVISNETFKGGVFDWTETGLKAGTRSPAEVLQEVRETIPRGLRSVRHHMLLGNDARAELDMTSVVQGHKLGGRADFVMRRGRVGDLVIIDGKGSRWRDKYTNSRQLRWYAMLHKMKFGVLPDQAGFLYWRYEPEESLDWEPITLDMVESLRVATLENISEIESAVAAIGKGLNPSVAFPASPNSDCKLCSYLSVCVEAKAALSKAMKEQIAASLSGVDDDDVSL